MRSNIPSDDLQGKHYLTVIVRLLLDERGGLVHGEVAGVGGGSGKRFVDWDSLVPAVRAWLAGGVDRTS